MASLHLAGGPAAAGRGLRGAAEGADPASPAHICRALSDAMLGGLLDRAQLWGRVRARALMSIVL